MQSQIEKRKKLNDFFESLPSQTQDAFLDLLQTLSGSQEENYTRASVDQYNNELNEAEHEIDKGEFSTNEEAMKIIRRWQNK